MTDPSEYYLKEVVRLVSPIQKPLVLTLAEAIEVIKNEPLPLKRRSFMIARDNHPAPTHRKVDAIYKLIREPRKAMTPR